MANMSWVGGTTPNALLTFQMSQEEYNEAFSMIREHCQNFFNKVLLA